MIQRRASNAAYVDQDDAVKRRTWSAGMLLIAALMVGGCSLQTDRIPVLLDHDGATDDYIALLMLAGSGRCDLRGVTVSYGLGHRDAAVQATRLLLAAMGLAAPVAGHDPALRGPNSFPDEWRDRSDHVLALSELQNLEAPASHPDAVALLIQLLDQTDQPVTVVATGPLTNIAAVLTQRPDLIASIGRLVVMGGALRVPGNVRVAQTSATDAVAEYNFFVDPAAADQVLALAAKGLDITIAPLDVTNELPLHTGWLNRLKGDDAFGARLASGILAVVEPQIEQGRYYLWDGAAVLAALSPETLRFEAQLLRVTTDGPMEGALRVTSNEPGRVNIAVGVADGTQPLERAASWITGAPHAR